MTTTEAIKQLQTEHDLIAGERDLISRQMAIDETWKEPTYTDPLNVLAELRDRIKDLPSAQPERKKGRWRRRLVDSGFNADWHCSECGWKTSLEEHGYNFCPNCGANMRGGQDDE